jgi:dihydroxyacetone kinase-like protein
MGAIMLTKEYFISSFNHIAEAVEEQKYYLSQLDSDIGDGDHGINLSIGFREVHANLPDLANTTKNIGELLNKIGFILLSKVGGASGPLYGGFHRHG